MQELEQKITEWMRKVLAAYEAGGMVDTLQMTMDIDRIIAYAFDHEPALPETQHQKDVELRM